MAGKTLKFGQSLLLHIECSIKQGLKQIKTLDLVPKLHVDSVVILNQIDYV